MLENSYSFIGKEFDVFCDKIIFKISFMNKLIYLFVGLFFSFVTISAQTLTVVDKATGSPIEGVHVYSSDFSVYTDASGGADLSLFVGARNISFQHYSYKDYSLSIDQLKKDNYIVALSETVFLLDEVVVSSNKWEQQGSEVPVRIVTIKPTEIAVSNPQTAADMLANTGAVFVQKSQLGGGSPMIRGFAANRVLIVVDGVRMNNAIYRSGNLQNVINVDPNMVENAEVIFGPGSVIYGSDAIGGVMDFHTLKSRLSTTDNIRFSTKALARYSSSNNEQTYSVAHTGGWKKLAYATSISYSNFGDLIMGGNGPDEYLKPHYVVTVNGIDKVLDNADPEKQLSSGYNQLNLLQKLRYRPSEKWNIEGGFIYSTTSDIPRYDRLVQEKNNIPVYAQWYYGPQQWLMTNISVNHNSNSWLFDSFNTIVAYQNYKESRHDRKLNKAELRNQNESVDIVSFNIDLDKKLSEKGTLFYGAEYLYNNVGSFADKLNVTTGKSKVTDSRYPDGSVVNSVSAYLNYKYELSSNLFLNSALRYSYISTYLPKPDVVNSFPFITDNVNQKMSSVNGSLGLAWNKSKSTSLSVNFSTGYRAPNIDDLAKVFGYDNDALIVPNYDLVPEYIYSIDAGINKKLLNRVNIYAGVFYSFLDNAMVRGDFTWQGQEFFDYDGDLRKVQAVVNADYATVYGADIALNIDITDNFAMKSNLTITKGEEKGGIPLRHAAPLFGSTHLLYSVRDFKFDFYSVYNGEISNENLAPTEQDKPYMYAIDANGNPYCPAWYTLNFRVRYNITKNFYLNTALENILDKRYRPYSSGIVAPGRNLVASLMLNF